MDSFFQSDEFSWNEFTPRKERGFESPPTELASSSEAVWPAPSPFAQSPRCEVKIDWDTTTPQKEDQGCNCSKSQCSKKCCRCYRAQRECGTDCGCKGCTNTARLSESLTSSGCTCKKSRCRKRYCECFSSAQKCGHGCRCINCFNGPTPQMDEMAALVRGLPLVPHVASYLVDKLTR